MNNLWWGEIGTSEQAAKIIFHASAFSFFVAGVLGIYGALYGGMAPGATDLLFGMPDGGMIGVIPGVLYATLALLLYKFTSRIAALAMTALACAVIIDNSVYHYLPLGTLPMLLVIWINIRAVRAAFACHQLTRLGVQIDAGVSRTRIWSQVPWYGVIGVVSLLVSVPNLVEIAIAAQGMRPSKSVPCTVIDKHEVPPSQLLGATGYMVNCRFINPLGEKKVVAGDIPKRQWEALQLQEQIQVEYRTIAPYSSRIRVGEDEWLWQSIIALVSSVLLVFGFLMARTKYPSRSGRNATPASPDDVLESMNRIV
jgi:hypothetical protein